MKTISRYLLTLVALLAMTTGAWADPNILVPTITGDREFYESVEVTMICTSPNADIYYTVNGKDPLTLPDNQQIEYKDPITLTETTTIMARAFDGNDWSAMVEVTFTKQTGPKVTFNDAKTTASFEMPGNDATVSYELVRDMTVSMPVTVGNGKNGYGIRLKKEGESWIPADMSPQDMAGLISVTDAIEQKTLTNVTDYTISIFALDEKGEIINTAIAFNKLVPGSYVAIATAKDGTIYEGTTAASNMFVLYEGYQVTVAAGEYATFYHNEKLRIEDTDAELYTIASVSTTEAVLSEKMTVAPSETPLLVYNAGSETKTFLLIPTADEASEAIVAQEFQGTTEAKDMPASSSKMDYYVCTGKAFTWVKDAGQIAANRCWLQIGANKQPAATRSYSRAITRGFGGIDGTTGIDAVENGEVTNEGYYDLNGRKVANPKRGGIYIHNGKKVIIH
jgi:hypothetical protein